MKTSFLTNLLVAFALGLCALCTFQWLRETRSRDSIQKLHDTEFKLQLTIQEHTNRIVMMDSQIASLTEGAALAGATIKSNKEAIQFLRAATNSLGDTNEYLAKVLGAYTNAFNDTTNRLAQAYDNLNKQNEVIKEVAKQRDEFVSRLNEAISNRNETIKEYNVLVDRVKQMQEAWDAANAKKPAK